MIRSRYFLHIVGGVLLVAGACATPNLPPEDDGVGLPDREDAGGEASQDATPADATTLADGQVDAQTDAADAGPAFRVFASSRIGNGNLGGLAGADTLCNDLATAAGLGGTYAAWLSNGGGAGPHAIDRVTSAGPWRLVSGELVASTKAELTSGTLRHAIDRDEKGVVVAPIRVWTGTGTDGRFSDMDCDKWTTGLRGRVGTTDASDGKWTSQEDDDCVDNKRVYCFEL